MTFYIVSVLLFICSLSIAQEFSFKSKFHFTQGRFKLDKKKYKYINTNALTRLKGPRNQSFEIEAIKSKDLTFYTLTIKRGDSIVLIINDFAVMSKTKKVRILKEGWVEDIDGDGILDIVQREKTFIVGAKKRAPSSEYSNDKLRLRTWSSRSKSYIELEKSHRLYKKALKKYNFKLYTLHNDKVI